MDRDNAEDLRTKTTPQFSNVPLSKATPFVSKPTAQRAFTGRHSVGRGQPSHDSVYPDPRQKNVRPEQPDRLGQRVSHRRCQQSQRFLKGKRLRPIGIGCEALLPRTGFYSLSRQVLSMDELDPVFAVHEFGKCRKSPQRLGHIVQLQVALARAKVGRVMSQGSPLLSESSLECTVGGTIFEIWLGAL